MESNWTKDEITARINSIWKTQTGSAAATIDTDHIDIGSKTPVLPMINQPLPAIDLAIIDTILRNAGIDKSFEAILNEADQEHHAYERLKEDYAHTKEVVTMLTRYRFCPHSEKKKRTGKLLEDLLKKIDEQEWIPPEFEGVDPQIVKQIREGKIKIVSDGTGNVILIPNDAENAENGNPKVTVIVSDDGTVKSVNGIPGGNEEEKPADDTSGAKPENSKPVKEDDASTQKPEDEHPAEDCNSEKKSEDTQAKADSTSDKKTGKHPRRTPGSLDRKFENVEHVKCYTAFNDQTGRVNDPPTDANGLPMIYVGEVHVRNILVRIPARYVLYECYSQTFRSMNKKECEEYRKTVGVAPEENPQGVSDEVKTVDAVSQEEGSFNEDCVFIDERDGDLMPEGIIDDELDAELDEELYDPEAMEEHFYSVDDNCLPSDTQNPFPVSGELESMENGSEAETDVNKLSDKEETDWTDEMTDGERLRNPMDTDKLAGMNYNGEEVYCSSSGPPGNSAGCSRDSAVESRTKEDNCSSDGYSSSGNHFDPQKLGDGHYPDSHASESG